MAYTGIDPLSMPSGIQSRAVTKFGGYTIQGHTLQIRMIPANSTGADPYAGLYWVRLVLGQQEDYQWLSWGPGGASLGASGSSGKKLACGAAGSVICSTTFIPPTIANATSLEQLKHVSAAHGGVAFDNGRPGMTVHFSKTLASATRYT